MEQNWLESVEDFPLVRLENLLWLEIFYTAKMGFDCTLKHVEGKKWKKFVF
jgi:hypothetical protein